MAIPNHTNGVTLYGVAGNTVGGTNAGARNVISGNQQLGVSITSTGASNNMVLGNYIGPDATGTNALANTYGGVTIDGAAGNMVGAVNGGNVISGNLGNGVLLVDPGTSNNIVSGNFIGVDATGKKAMANNLAGVYIEVPGNTIGGVAPGAGNVISGNAENGVFIYGGTTSNNVVEGNFIGTDVTGRNSGGERVIAGVAISNAPANLIGGAAGGAGNVISGNASSGISLGGNTSGTVIQGNYIGTDLYREQRGGQLRRRDLFLRFGHEPHRRRDRRRRQCHFGQLSGRSFGGRPWGERQHDPGELHWNQGRWRQPAGQSVAQH